MKNIFLITGCSRGIGLALVERALSESENMVFGVSRSHPPQELAQLASKNSSEWIWIQADLSTEDGRKKVADVISKKNVGLTHVLHNAATIICKQWFEYTYEDYRTVFDVNFWSPLHLTQLILPYLLENSHVVFISSMGGFQGSKKFPGMALYTASKAAIVNLVESLSVELAQKGIKVNSLCPGAVDTDMLHQAFPAYQAKITPHKIGDFIYYFLKNAHQVINGKIIPVSLNDPDDE
ncbi:MAG: SDR family oxidoreductase [Bacteroidales bacterium]|nr:SDR family oxidoreductase [Bacteroidales bacterium]